MVCFNVTVEISDHSFIIFCWWKSEEKDKRLLPLLLLMLWKLTPFTHKHSVIYGMRIQLKQMGLLKLPLLSDWSCFLSSSGLGGPKNYETINSFKLGTHFSWECELFYYYITRALGPLTRPPPHMYIILNHVSKTLVEAWTSISSLYYEITRSTANGVRSQEVANPDHALGIE